MLKIQQQVIGSVATQRKIGYLNLVTRALGECKQDSEELGIPVMTAATVRTAHTFSFNRNIGKSMD